MKLVNNDHKTEKQIDKNLLDAILNQMIFITQPIDWVKE